MILTADHGNDPTWPGTDHTRENVPVMVFGPEITRRGIAGRSVGQPNSFSDMAQTIAAHLGLPPLKHGTNVI